MPLLHIPLDEVIDRLRQRAADFDQQARTSKATDSVGIDPNILWAHADECRSIIRSLRQKPIKGREIMTPQERETASNVITEAIVEQAATKLAEAADQFEMGTITHAELLSAAAARLRECGITDLTAFVDEVLEES